MIVNNKLFRVFASNRKAKHNYYVLEDLEVGVELYSTEVKSIREGKVSIKEAYAYTEGGEMFVYNMYIANYSYAPKFSYDTRRKRKLLLHKREINKFIGKVKKESITLIPLEIYSNKRGKIKISLALCKGKKLYDKREVEKKREWDRQKERLLKEQ